MKSSQALLWMGVIFLWQSCQSINKKSQVAIADSVAKGYVDDYNWNDEIDSEKRQNFDSLFQLIRPVILKHFPYDSILARLKKEGEIVDTVGEYFEEDDDEYDNLEMERTAIYFHKETNEISLNRDYPETNSSYDNWCFKVFVMNDTIRCLYLKNGGVGRHSMTDELILYTYDTSKKSFYKDQQAASIFDMRIRSFFKPITPDSIMDIAERNNSHSYYFGETGIVQHNYYCEADSEEYCPKSWALGDVIVYDIENGKLVKREPYFER